MFISLFTEINRFCLISKHLNLYYSIKFPLFLPPLSLVTPIYYHTTLPPVNNFFKFFLLFFYFFRPFCTPSANTRARSSGVDLYYINIIYLLNKKRHYKMPFCLILYNVDIYIKIVLYIKCFVCFVEFIF